MRSPKFYMAIVFFATSLSSFAQLGPQRELPAKRTAATFKIDGILDEAAWREAPVATDFIEWRPNAGAKELNKTEVWILYDNTSIYIGGYCHEKTADSVSRELAGRDRVGNSDFVGVIFDTYNDKINAVGFYVTTTGEQFDAKYSPTSGEDANWSAVWESEAKIHSDGWSFEMRIPYSALRFTSKENQNWGMNITRRRQKTSQQYMWNPVNPKLDGFINQEGLWTGIGKIESPLRLSFSPYLSFAVNNYPYNSKDQKNTTSKINGGMDIKYGVSQSFTLDMTLIPDFGQVQSDKLVYNRSPFEVRYDETRPFFTEGTELFNKGNLFYSRRIGKQKPINFYNAGNNLSANEVVIDNPVESKLINATKFSGRTSKGLGIGVFNALTKPMYATIADKVSGIEREYETAPLTNYNVFVLDQTLKNNSSVSLINTNVMRSGDIYDANVTAGLFDFYNKKNIYNWNGKVGVSNKFYQGKTITGYMHSLTFGKPGGNFNFQFNQELLDDKYDQTDLGFMYNNNYFDHNLWMGYKLLKPTKWYNRIYLNMNFGYSTRYKPAAYQMFFTNFNANGQLKNLSNVGIYVGYNAKGNDFYEPHRTGYVYKTPQRYMADLWYNSNSNKKYSYNIELYLEGRDIKNYITYQAIFGHKYRFNDKFSLSQSTNITITKNDIGFAGFDSLNNDVFALRNLPTVNNQLNLKYNPNKKHGITFSARHYWSQTDAISYYTISPKGGLTPNTLDDVNANYNFNIFNIDMIYTWEFAPGSFINVVWKNEISPDGDPYVHRKYFQNFKHTIETSQTNNFSIKILYYLDYLKLAKKAKHV